MRLTASCEFEMQAPDPVAAVLMLRPRSGWGQWISREEYQFEPGVGVVEFTDGLGNICQRFIAPAGETRVVARCTADAADEVDVDPEAAFVPPQDLPEGVLSMILPSRYCPSDELGDLAAEISREAAPGYPQVEAIRAWIRGNVEYRYGHSNSSTSAADTARDRVGVCRDFTHLGIALCRALNIPARMVAGYSRFLDTPDMHAWFEAYVGGRWFTFDATQDRTTGDRIAVAYGRDAVDVALLTSFGPLNMTPPRVVVAPAEQG